MAADRLLAHLAVLRHAMVWLLAEAVTRRRDGKFATQGECPESGCGRRSGHLGPHGRRHRLGGAVFTSPVDVEGLTFDQAVARLKSEHHRAFRAKFQAIDQDAGLQSSIHSTIGDTKEYGTEDAFVSFYPQGSDYETVRYAAARKGLAANQKTVLPFQVDKTGPDSLYSMDIPSRDLGSIRKTLDEHGVEFRTFDVGPPGSVRVWIYDQGSGLRANMERLGEHYGIDIRTRKGRGEFLGGDTREEGRAVFERVINAFERRRQQSLTAAQDEIGGRDGRGGWGDHRVLRGDAEEEADEDVADDDPEIAPFLEYIVKVADGYRIISHTTGKNLGTFSTRAAAKRRLKQLARFAEAVTRDNDGKFASQGPCPESGCGRGHGHTGAHGPRRQIAPDLDVMERLARLFEHAKVPGSQPTSAVEPRDESLDVVMTDAKLHSEAGALFRDLPRNVIEDLWASAGMDSMVALRAAAQRLWGGEVFAPMFAGARPMPGTKVRQAEEDSLKFASAFNRTDKERATPDDLRTFLDDYLKAQYAWTQLALKDQPDTITLYRGLRLGERIIKRGGARSRSTDALQDRFLRHLDKSGQTHLKVGALSSLTSDPEIAKYFGTLLEFKIPKKYVVATNWTGLGTRNESEWVIAGDTQKFEAKLIQKKDWPTLEAMSGPTSDDLVLNIDEIDDPNWLHTLRRARLSEAVTRDADGKFASQGPCPEQGCGRERGHRGLHRRTVEGGPRWRGLIGDIAGRVGLHVDRGQEVSIEILDRTLASDEVSGGTRKFFDAFGLKALRSEWGAGSTIGEGALRVAAQSIWGGEVFSRAFGFEGGYKPSTSGDREHLMALLTVKARERLPLGQTVATQETATALQEYLRAQYALTQMAMEKKGVPDTITLYRGLTLPPDRMSKARREATPGGVNRYARLLPKWKTGATVQVKLGALSSLSEEQRTAEDFGPAVLEIKVPRSAVVANSATGLGVEREKEWVIAGDNQKFEAKILRMPPWWVRPGDKVFDPATAPKMVTEAQEVAEAVNLDALDQYWLHPNVYQEAVTRTQDGKFATQGPCPESGCGYERGHAGAHRPAAARDPQTFRPAGFTPAPSFDSMEQAKAWLGTHYPGLNTREFFSAPTAYAFDMPTVSELVGAWHDLAQRFPWVAKEIGFLSVNGTWDKARTTRMAETSFPYEGSASGVIAFNPSYLEHSEPPWDTTLGATTKTGFARGWLAAPGTAAVMAHEFGHALDYAWRADTRVTGSVRRMTQSLATMWARGTGPSEYAETEPGEFFAEAFSAWYHRSLDKGVYPNQAVANMYARRRAQTSDAVAKMDKLLRQAMARTTREEITRDNDGKFASQGPCPESGCGRHAGHVGAHGASPKWKKSKDPHNEFGFSITHNGRKYEVYWDQGSSSWRSLALVNKSASGGTPVDFVGHNKADVIAEIESGELAAKIDRYAPEDAATAHAVAVDPAFSSSVAARARATVAALVAQYGVPVTAIKPALVPGALAHKSRDAIYLDPARANDPAFWAAYAKEWDGLRIDPTLEGTLVHEYGHILFGRALNKNPKRYHAEVTALLDRRTSTTTPYGMEDNAEMEAEAFAAVHLGRVPPGPFAQQHMERARAITRAMLAILHGKTTQEAVTRDNDGKFSSQGPCPESGCGRDAGHQGEHRTAPHFTLTKRPFGDGVLYDVKVGRESVVKIAGFERDDVFHMYRVSDLRADLRGSGLFRAVVQDLADKYPQGLFVFQWEASKHLRDSLAKMPTFEVDAEKERLHIRPRRAHQEAVTRNPDGTFATQGPCPESGCGRGRGHEGAHGEPEPRDLANLGAGSMQADLLLHPDSVSPTSDSPGYLFDHYMHLGKLDPDIARAARGLGGIQILVSTKSMGEVADDLGRSYLLGTASGWHGTGWKKIPGGYISEQRLVVAGNNGGHGARSLLLHELGHALHHTLMNNDDLQALRGVWSREIARRRGGEHPPEGTLMPYFKQRKVNGNSTQIPVPQGLKETIAESVARRTLGGRAGVMNYFGPVWAEAFETVWAKMKKIGQAQAA